MKKYINPDKSEWLSLVKRVSVNDDVIAGRVEAILARVKSDGDKAILVFRFKDNALGEAALSGN